MYILGIDFETQHDDARTCNVTEVGAILVNQKFQVISKGSGLCHGPDYPPQTAEIVELTHITDEMLEYEGAPPKAVFEKVIFPLVESTQYVFAHNKSFDETVYYSTSERLGLNPPKRTWICTVTEVDYPKKFTCKKLSHLAFDHGIIPETTDLHRSLADVELMLRVLALYPLEDVIAYSQEPWVYIQAIFPAPFGATAVEGTIGKQKAQKLGYGWEKCKGDDKVFSKQWMKRVKQRHVALEQEKAQKLDLNIRILTN